MTTRERFEQWYVENAFDYARDPIGSRECGLQWASYQAAYRMAIEDVRVAFDAEPNDAPHHILRVLAEGL